MAKKSAPPILTPASEDSFLDMPSSEGVSKAEAMRDALKAGLTKPTDAVKYILDKFGIDLSLKQFSNFKSAEKAKSGTTKRRMKKATAAAAPEAAPVAAAAPASTKNGKASNPAELARQVKSLVQTFGAGTVKNMVEVFAD